MNRDLVSCYLSRLGLSPDIKEYPLTYETLKKLQYAHVTRIAYENLDILEDRSLALTGEAAANKIAKRGRGGYCFELNGAFVWLLSQLGFEVVNLFARYLRGETEIPVRRHRVLLVKCGEERFLCDVGVGERAPRYPLRMEDNTVQEQFGESYRFSEEPFLGHVLSDFYKGAWVRFFSFTEEPQLDKDYIMPSFWCEKHPDSPFNKDYMLAIKTEDGRKTLSGHVFRVFSENGEKVTEQFLSEEEVKTVMRDHFYLSVD